MSTSDAGLVLKCRLVPGIASPDMIARIEREPETVAAREQMIAAADKIPFEAIGDGRQIRQRLRVATVRMTGDGLTNERVGALRDTVAEFLAIRYGQTSASRYREWRVAGGYSLRQLQHVLPKAHLEAVYRVYFKSTPPPDASSEGVFDSLWHAGVKHGEGANRPVGMACSSTGLAIVVSEETKDGEPFTQPEGELSRSVWNGTTTMTFRSWWESVAPRPAHGPWLCASVGIFFEFANGVRRPVKFYFRWNSTRSTWRLDGIGASHIETADKVTALEY